MTTSTRTLAFLAVALAGLPLLARADHVADDDEVGSMKARILKNPPTAETLAAQPYPGAKLDIECSASQSAENGGDPMVYCLYTKDPLDKVNAHLAGPGKPGPGVWATADTADVANAQHYVIVSDVSEIRYFVNAKKKAEAQQAAASPAPAVATAAPAQSEPAAGTSAAAGDGAPPASPETEKKKKKKHKDGADAASEAADAVNSLKGLFGH
jgi:hypothetical protein